MHASVRRALGVTALGGVLLVGLAVPAGAQADLVGDRAVTVEPATGLTDGQTVTVSWTGYDANSSLNIIQCADPSGLKSETCNTAAAKFDVPAGAEGEGSTELVVHTGETGPDGVCDAGENNECVVAINQDLVDGQTATAPITFAAAADGGGELAATGSTTTPLALGAAGLIGVGIVLARRKLRATV